MKKTLIILFTFLLSTFITANDIGFIDTEMVLQKAKFVKIFQENFAEKEKEFKELAEKKQKKIEEAVKNKKPEEEIREMIAKRDEELQPKQQELMQYDMSFRQTFMLNVTSTAKKVAEDLGITMVVDKQVVYFGGLDLTDLVIEKLNK